MLPVPRFTSSPQGSKENCVEISLDPQPYMDTNNDLFMVDAQDGCLPISEKVPVPERLKPGISIVR